MNALDLTQQVKDHIGHFMEADASHLQPATRIATAFDGIDSMKQFEMVVYLEEKFEIEFEEELLDRLETLGDIVEYIQHRLAQKP